MDASKLKAGDVVTVECEAVSVSDTDWRVRKSSDFDLPRIGDNYLRARRILSIKPRPIAVGDTVRLDGIASLDWSVVHVHETRAWIERRDASGAKFADIVQLSDLTRADASDAGATS